MQEFLELCKEDDRKAIMDTSKFYICFPSPDKLKDGTELFDEMAVLLSETFLNHLITQGLPRKIPHDDTDSIRDLAIRYISSSRTLVQQNELRTFKKSDRLAENEVVYTNMLINCVGFSALDPVTKTLTFGHLDYNLLENSERGSRDMKIISELSKRFPDENARSNVVIHLTSGHQSFALHEFHRALINELKFSADNIFVDVTDRGVFLLSSETSYPAYVVDDMNLLIEDLTRPGFLVFDLDKEKPIQFTGIPAIDRHEFVSKTDDDHKAIRERLSIKI